MACAESALQVLYICDRHCLQRAGHTIQARQGMMHSTKGKVNISTTAKWEANLGWGQWAHFQRSYFLLCCPYTCVVIYIVQTYKGDQVQDKELFKLRLPVLHNSFIQYEVNEPLLAISVPITV